MAAAIECGARTIAAVHWRPKFLQMKMSGLYRCLSGAYGEPVACRWNTKEATIMMARPGDLSLVGTEFDFAVIDDANESEGEVKKDFLSVHQPLSSWPLASGYFSPSWQPLFLSGLSSLLTGTLRAWPDRSR